MPLLLLILACAGDPIEPAPGDPGTVDDTGQGSDEGGDSGGIGDGGGHDSGIEPALPDTPTGRWLGSFDELDVTTVEGVRVAGYFSAGMVGAMTLEPLQLVQETPDPNCPNVVEKDGVIVYEGDCTDALGSTWTGVAVVTQMVELYDFGFQRPHPECKDVVQKVVTSGVVQPEPGGQRWSIDVISDVADADHTCLQAEARFGAVYTLEANETKDGTFYSGRGHVGFGEYGWALADTKGELLSSCANEPDAGVTTVRAADHVLTIPYDGLERCTNPGTALMLLDGEEVGSHSIPTCSATPRRGGLAGLLALVLGLGLRRRRG